MALKLISLFPKPELIIYLEISKEKSIERKNDLTHDQLKTLEKSFNELSLKFENFIKINCENKNIDQITNEIYRITRK